MNRLIPSQREALIGAARTAALSAYAPYSSFKVGAALLFEDGAIITGANMENASYGLSLCAETVACAIASHAGRRGGLVAVAVVGGLAGIEGPPVTPCGRCRQVLTELAQLGDTDPLVISPGMVENVEMWLSELLPRAFGPSNLS